MYAWNAEAQDRAEDGDSGAGVGDAGSGAEAEDTGSGVEARERSATEAHDRNTFMRYTPMRSRP